jgi:uncharacterized OB-fold protein
MATPYQAVTFPAPAQYPDAKAFWEGASRGELLLGHCGDCSEPHWYPRGHCPLCGSLKTGLVRAAGTGSIYSVSVTRRAGPVPFAIAYVTLDEGVTLLTHIIDCDLDEIGIGDRVEVVFRPSESGQLIPVFRPATAV